jgi:hypothetical protein
METLLGRAVCTYLIAVRATIPKSRMSWMGSAVRGLVEDVVGRTALWGERACLAQHSDRPTL